MTVKERREKRMNEKRDGKTGIRNSREEQQKLVPASINNAKAIFLFRVLVK